MGFGCFKCGVFVNELGFVVNGPGGWIGLEGVIRWHNTKGPFGL